MEFFRNNPGAAEALRGPLFEDKVVDFVLELAKVDRPAGEHRRNWPRSQMPPSGAS